MSLLNILHHADPFQIIPGSAAIAVGAPHHGTQPQVEADWGTGPIAIALANRLKGRAVVVSNLRRTVDVNKNPSTLGRSVCKHAIRYQNALFADRPSLILEIHGHKTGNYDIEISTGFELNKDIPSDEIFLKELLTLKGSLSEIMGINLGKRPTVGVWPIDRDVVKTATNTFTFQKVRRARQLVGLNWYGLHFELHPALRVSGGTRNGRILPIPQQMVAAIADSFAAAIQKSFYPLPGPMETIPTWVNDHATNHSFNKITCKVSRSTDDHFTRNMIRLHPESLHGLGVLEGDDVFLNQGDEEMQCIVFSSLLVKPGTVELNQRIRNQINVKPGQQIVVERQERNIIHQTPVDHYRDLGQSLVVDQILPDELPLLWFSEYDLIRLSLRAGMKVRVQIRADLPPVHGNVFPSRVPLPPRAVQISTGFAEKSRITLGETLRLLKD